eukprot:2637173-Amphidinium_carterae.1
MVQHIIKSPNIAQTWHAGLLDMQKQLGFPTLFLTIAPYEWSFPYHAFMEDEMQKLLLSRTYLGGAEALHLAHVLTQTAVGPETGSMLAAALPWEQGWFWQQNILNYFARLEFQDMRSTWRGDGMTLLEFIRKSNDVGAIARHIKSNGRTKPNITRHFCPFASTFQTFLPYASSLPYAMPLNHTQNTPNPDNSKP